MDPIHFLPESKHCYDLISEELNAEKDTQPSISLESIDSTTDHNTLGNYFLNSCETGNIPAIRKLLDLAKDLVDYRDTDGYTGLHRASYNGHVDAIEFLISAGADPAAQTNDGWQPLHCACRWNQVDAAFLLLQKNVSINSQTFGGQTPLHLASTTPDHAKTLEMLLLNENIDISLKNGANETPYQLAVRSGSHYKIFEIADPSI